MAYMTDEARAARNAYRRKWAKEHPENIKRQQQTYWEKKAREAQDQVKEKSNEDNRGRLEEVL